MAADPAFATGSLYLAKALFDAGDLQGAAEAARRGLAGNPEARTAALGHYVLADVYTQPGARATPRARWRRRDAWSGGGRGLVLPLVPGGVHGRDRYKMLIDGE